MVTSRGSRVVAESVLLQGETNRDVRLGSKTVLTPLKWDVCFTPRKQTSVSFAATVIGGMTQTGKARIYARCRTFVMAESGPTAFAPRR
jgi:hypothetical protein